ncbi:SIS domain-containing protein [Bacteriovorax sp. Seq25_V]|uniref:KpsF/GutQ family sugar-phosphate isomerase n=1 Tax=Bacteriovorax sp. Seq25_V TaxID=1201288 RepID=UPI000389FA27|nr:KpsF/GutQ family sugar-phosphate isomerase [Bacteriovorax sp. Seq25_V]EQC47594.1 sugar isomerase, KpsF/GutQ family [Bacteriovorax sp. Seq25_V]
MNALEQMKRVLELEANSITRVMNLLDEVNCNLLVDLYKKIRATNNQIVFCGVGKSGLIAQKLSSTFASLGLRSIFLHPTEALHGDLGRIGSDDAIAFLSKSGNTEEILKLLPFISNSKDNLIAMVGNTKNEIAQKCGIVLDCSVEKEACLNNLAPTTSSTVALAMGDAMAVLYESVVNLSKEGFAKNHPGGLLGKSLVMKVRDLMWDKAQCPTLDGDKTLRDAIFEMTKNPAGACAILNAKGELEGLLVEGDIRRNLAKSDQAINFKLKDIMTKSPVVTTADSLAYSALEVMETKERQIYVLPVLDNGIFVGFLRMHDLLKEGFSK